ncbi:MAG: hypothetical protein HYS32_00085 [Candidatus Woesearchaeota archaeon]|nr:MAG: hypothetical protein HYS32_00085 [Candidatus Woesearchaeota archaeon]
MVNGVFFDYDGVLGGLSVRSAHAFLQSRGKIVDYARLKALVIHEDAFTGPRGTVQRLQREQFADLKFEVDDLASFVEEAPLFLEVWQIARELRSRGTLIGILSDATAETADVLRFRNDPIFVFDIVIFSSDPNVRLSKRGRGVFDLAARRAEKNPGDLLMIDDSDYPRASAIEAGWNAVKYKDPQTLREDLGRYHLL